MSYYLANRRVIRIDVYVYGSPNISRFSFTFIIIKTTMLLENYLKNYAT